MGLKTALITIRKDRIGEMSCNPAIGGLGKGQIVREIDALGGLMGLAADATGIQFRMLNRSKGPAVQAPRAQSDRHRYQKWMEERLCGTANLSVIESMATDILVADGVVCGVVCADGTEYSCRTVVVAAGTFLRGQMYIGDDWWDGGRIEEPASCELSVCMEKLGLEVKRLATGTPPRLDASTIDYDIIEEQRGDVEPVPFSFLNDSVEVEQVSCWMTYTNEKIHELLMSNMHRAPISLGTIRGTKPRYCPSIEAKMLRFPDKKRHRIFLEPEEGQCRTIYCNGLFTSVPRDVQDEMLRLMPGTANAKILRYGYGIEYDYCPPCQLKRSLETRKIDGLFLAGQINATSGYEEAAGQGIIAGINAGRKVGGLEPLILGRDQAYIGVMIDDLLTSEIDEPYRMFTSRSEFRLSLRADNADRRLTAIGREVGLVDDERWGRYCAKLDEVEKLTEIMRNTRYNGTTMWQEMQRPDSELASSLTEHEVLGGYEFSKACFESVTNDAKYAGYVVKQQRLVKQMSKLENSKMPEAMDYESVLHLRAEARQRLSALRPATLGQALRVNGITPADITVLQIHIKKYH
jgi:tRNA uridine 5-carboxymethylaminomethyl modification enzyme